MTYEELPFSGIATFFKAPPLAAPTRSQAHRPTARAAA